MPTDKPPPVAAAVPSPSLTDLASRINTEFAAIQKAEQDANNSNQGDRGSAPSAKSNRNLKRRLV